VNKEQPKILREVVEQALCNNKVSVVDIDKDIGAGRLGELTKLFLARVHYSL